jgi:ribonuclease D
MTTLKEFQICEQDLSDAMLSAYLQADAIAVDTETMGLLPWRDRLCLVQLCNPQGQVTVITIAKGQKSAPNLKQLLEANSAVKIFHYARFDLAILKYQLDIYVNPVFCTKIASKLARTYSPRHGLKEVVLELEKIELDKSSQSSDWGNPDNFTEKQLSYAANDVRYLISAKDKLIKMLAREERLELAEKCFQCLPTLVELDLMQYQDIFAH